MAIGSSNVTTSAVKTEIGSGSNAVSALVGAAGLNKYSFYAPGDLSVDGLSDVVLTPVSSNYKLGDFRLYNHLSTTPSAQSNYQQNWGPAAGDFNFNVSWFPEAMNIKEFAVYGDYVTMNFYTSVTGRTAESGRVKQQINSITYSPVTPLTGHTRQPVYQAAGTQAPTPIYNYPYGGLSNPDTTIYMETFISDISGNRKINLGVRANNYTTITFHKNQVPHIHVGGNFSAPTGYTAAFPSISTGSTACETQNPINMTFGSSDIYFYVKIRAVSGSSQYILEATHAHIELVIGEETQTLYQGALAYGTPGTLIDTTLTISGGIWNYEEEGTINITNIAYGASRTGPC